MILSSQILGFLRIPWRVSYMGLLGPTPRGSDSVPLGSSLEIYTAVKMLGDVATVSSRNTL